MQRRTLVDNKWVRFLEDKFSLPNGSECTYYHAQKPDAVMAIAVESYSLGEFTYIVNQHRHPIEKSIWQFPIGGFDIATEDPVASARKELREETGVMVGEMDYIGNFYADPGFTNQKIHVCASNDILEIGQQQLENTEQGLVCKKVEVSSIVSLIDSGEMGDGWGLAGHYYLQKYLSVL